MFTSKANVCGPRALIRHLAALSVVGACSAPAVASAQTAPGQDPAGTPAEPPAAEPAAAAAEPAPQPAAPPEAAAAPPEAAPEATPSPAPTPAPPPEASPEPARDADAIGPGMHVVGLEAWFGLEASQATLRGDYTGLGAALGVRTCLLCMLFGESRFAGGDLLGIDSGLGYQSPESSALGSMWALLRIDVGLQMAARPVDDLEVVLRYYVISHLNTVRDVGSSDDVYVLEPGVRYRQFLLDVGFGAKPFRYPLLAEHGDTASAFTLKGRYLLDLKKGYYAGASYEKLSGPASEPYSSNVFRLMLGVQN